MLPPPLPVQRNALGQTNSIIVHHADPVGGHDLSAPSYSLVSGGGQPRVGTRVLMLNYEYPPLGGGAAVATAALAERFAARGIRVDVVTSACFERNDRQSPAHARRETALDRLHVHRVAARRRSIHQAGFATAGSYLMNALPVVRELVRRHDYSVVHFFFSLPTGALMPLVQLRGAATVVSLRGSDVPGYDRHNPRLQAAHRMLRPLTRSIWRRADRVVAVCRHLGELARRTDPGLHYSVIGNGVNLDRFRPAASNNAGARPLRCIAVTRMVERKGVADLVRAWALLRRGEYALELVGTGPAEERLRRLVAELGLAGEITFAGALSHEAVAERYGHSDMFTLAPHDEAFGNVFGEALASGLPIVSSNIGGIPELVEDGANGILVDPGDIEALARAITTLGEDAVRREQMRVRNRERAEALLSWDRVTDRYLALYDEVMAGMAVRPLDAAVAVSR